MSWTDEDRQNMEAAANAAEKELLKLLKNNPDMTAIELMQFHSKWCMTAGHKRLGKMYRDFAKAL